MPKLGKLLVAVEGTSYWHRLADEAALMACMADVNFNRVLIRESFCAFGNGYLCSKLIFMQLR